MANPYLIAKMDLPPIQAAGDDLVIPETRVLGEENNSGQSADSTGTAGDGSNAAGLADREENSGLPQSTGPASTAPADPAGAIAEGAEARQEHPADDGVAPADPASNGTDGTDGTNNDAAAAADADFARQYRELDQNYRQNPAQFVTQLLHRMPADAAADVLRSLGVGATPSPDSPSPLARGGLRARGEAEASDWRGEGEGLKYQFQEDNFLTPEEHFVKHQVAPTLAQLRQQAAALPQFQQQVSGVVGQHAGFINDLLYSNAVLQQQVQALMEHAELALPAADKAAIDLAVRSGKSYTEAAKSVYGEKAKTAVAAAKAKAAPKPTTPRNAASGTAELPKNASFYQLWKATEAELLNHR